MNDMQRCFDYQMVGEGVDKVANVISRCEPDQQVILTCEHSVVIVGKTHLNLCS